MACRFPGADSPEAFWQNLAAGVDSICDLPKDRWPIHDYYDATGQPGKSCAKQGGFLADIRGFDANFFKIASEDAMVMDPQHRLLLELAYETLERGGYPKSKRKNLSTGIFLGVSQSSYTELTMPLLHSGQPVNPAITANNLRNLMAGRIANRLNLTGPRVGHRHCLLILPSCPPPSPTKLTHR